MKNKTIALYPGSFNDFHIGHLNILEKAENIFGNGNVVVCIGLNPEKINSDSKDQYLVAMDKKCQQLEKRINRKVEYFSGFLHEYVEIWESGGYNVVVVRGLRNGDDLDYEINQLRFIKDFKNDIKVVFIPCDKEFEHISSSAIRMIEQFGGKEAIKNYTV